MTNLNSNYQQIEKERFIWLILLLFIVSSLPFSNSLNSKAIIAFTLYGLWLWIKSKEINKDFMMFLVANLLITIVSLAGLVYTYDFTPAFKLFETRISMVIFPLILLLSIRGQWDKNLIKKTLLGFALVTLLAGLFIEGSLLWELIRDDKSLTLFFYWRNSNDILADRIGIHPTYLSMYAIFSIVIVYELIIWKNLFSFRTVLGYVVIAYLVMLTLHLAARISLVILAPVLVVIFVNSVRQFRFRSLWVIVPLIAFCAYLLNLKIFAITDRYNHPIHNPFARPQPGTTDDRWVAWFSSFQIIQENYWLGVGTGDATAELNTMYRTLEADALAEQNLNSHNQFLDSLIRNGIPGLASLLIMYLYGLYDTRFRNRLYIMFVIIVVITSLTENILDRQKGAVFWSVFNVLLYQYSRENH